MTRPRRTITCARCGQERLHQARGLCSTCYEYSREHGTLDEYSAVGRGPKAQQEAPSRRLTVCVSCGECRPHAGRGLCNRCYPAARRAGTLDQWAEVGRGAKPGQGPRPQLIVCAECGEQRPHQARGLCSRCYEASRLGGTLEQHAPTPPQIRTTGEAAEQDPGLAAFLRERRCRISRRDRLKHHQHEKENSSMTPMTDADLLQLRLDLETAHREHAATGHTETGADLWRRIPDLLATLAEARTEAQDLREQLAPARDFLAVAS